MSTCCPEREKSNLVVDVIINPVVEIEDEKSYRRYRVLGGLLSISSFSFAVKNLASLKLNALPPWHWGERPYQHFREIIPGSILDQLNYVLRGILPFPGFDYERQTPALGVEPFQLSDGELAIQARLICLLN